MKSLGDDGNVRRLFPLLLVIFIVILFIIIFLYYSYFGVVLHVLYMLI